MCGGRLWMVSWQVRHRWSPCCQQLYRLGPGKSRTQDLMTPSLRTGDTSRVGVGTEGKGAERSQSRGGRNTTFIKL